MRNRAAAVLLLVVFDALIVLNIAYTVGEESMPLSYMFSLKALMRWAGFLGVAGPIVLGYALWQMRPLSAAGLIQKVLFVGSSVLIVLYTIGVLYGFVERGLHSLFPSML